MRIVNGPETMESVEQILKESADKGFYPYGLSFNNGRMWYFLLKLVSSETHSVFIERYKKIDDKLIASVEELQKKGYTPWSMAVSFDWVYIVYGK